MGGIERFGLPKQGGVPASQAVKADGWLFVAGQVPKNAEGEFVVGGIAEQARQTLDNLMKTLRQAGYGPEDVVKVNVWLDDPRDFCHLQPHLQPVFLHRTRPGPRDRAGAYDERFQGRDGLRGLEGTPMNASFDVVIVGGGVTGAAVGTGWRNGA